MRILSGNVRNFSNSFTNTQDVSSDLLEVMSRSKDGVFGIETVISGGEGVYHRIIAPSSVRLRESSVVNRLEVLYEYDNLYEGYLYRPLFFPLYEGLKGEFVSHIESLSDCVPHGDSIFIQWLFQKADRWKNKALEMYESYLEGNDDPVSFRWGRSLQDKTIHLLNRVASFPSHREVEDEVERKLLGDGYRFQLRLGILSEQPEVLRNEVQLALGMYDSLNQITLHKQTSKRAKKVMREFMDRCQLTYATSLQILGEGEIHSLFSTEQRSIVPLPSITTNQTDSAVAILPYVPRDEVQEDENLINKVAESLKRVGIIKQARLYNESVITGVRLTLVQFDIPKGKTLSHLVKHTQDIQAALGVPSLGIEQGEEPDTVKMTLPVEKPAIISLREMLEDDQFLKYKKENELAFVAGVDELSNPIYLSLAKMVHLLVAGTSGSGKSVFLNSLAVTLMVSYTPEQLQMVMIDPKQVEMAHFRPFPHVSEVITDVSLAASTLNSLTREMERRYALLSEAGVRNLDLYNKQAKETVPRIVCMIDEYADLVDVHGEVESFVARLGQKARAAGIHLVLATQRPSADIVSGRIKAVIPSAISFNLNNTNNYRTVFGSGIPYTLLGKGDGVMRIEGHTKEFQRFQSVMVSPNEGEEIEVYQRLSEYLGDSKQSISLPEATHEPSNQNKDSELLNRLKQVLATTGETRIAKLREQLSIKTATLSELMNTLVEEGWLHKHESKAKGFEIIAEEEELEKWRS